jgi:hypothetical protein
MQPPERHDNCGSGGKFFTATQAQMAPQYGYGQPSVSDSIWSSPGAYGRISIGIHGIPFCVVRPNAFFHSHPCFQCSCLVNLTRRYSMQVCTLQSNVTVPVTCRRWGRFRSTSLHKVSTAVLCLACAVTTSPPSMTGPPCAA